MLFGWELRVPLEAPQGFREAVVKAMFGKEMGQAEFPWRPATVMSRRQRHIYIYIYPRSYIFPPWSQPLSSAINTKALSKGLGTEGKA